MVTGSDLTTEQEYATLGDKEAPASAEIEQGVVALERLPAEWYNYYIALITVLNNKAKAKLDNIIAELDGMLTEAGIVPNGSLTTQMTTLLKQLPVGNNEYGCIIRSSAMSFTEAVTRSGFYILTTDVTDTPFTNTAFGWVTYFGTGNAIAYFKQWGGARTHSRSIADGTWGAWITEWNSSNDGALSGLDSDMLEGLHAILSGGTGVQISGTIRDVADCDSVTGNGVFFQTSNPALHTPVANEFFSGLQFYLANNSSYKHQFGYCAGAYYYRIMSAGTFDAWIKLYSTGTVGTNWAAVLSSTLGTNWSTALGTALGSNWTTALSATLGSGWTTVLAAALGANWSTALSNPAITVPSVTSDPGSPVVGQMWLRSDL